jgi:class 3 adenylate cyclase
VLIVATTIAESARRAKNPELLGRYPGPMERTTGFARVGTAQVAYQVTGTGPIDLVSTPGSFTSFDVASDDPLIELFFRRLASFTRLIRFDRRGMGASDPVSLDALPHLDSYAEETLAVMDTVGSERAAIMAGYDAGPMAMLLSATRPERVSALVLSNTTARPLFAPDYPIGLDPDAADLLIGTFAETWGTEQQVAMFVPSRADDPRFLSWFAKMERMTISPAQAAAYLRAMMDLDVRSVLPSIQVPTLVLHRNEVSIPPIAQAEYLAEHIPGARLVAVPGRDAPFIWEHQDLVLDALEDFLTGIGIAAPSERIIATVLFTDIVDSTRRADELGDRRWRALLDVHDEIAAAAVSAYEGRLIKHTGDGFMATFDRPGRALEAATEFRRRVAEVGIDIRTGLHTGEVVLSGTDVGGLAVHLASRVMDLAGSGQIMVSRTVKDLVVGSEFRFVDQGQHTLKGLEGQWELFSVEPGR